MYILYIVKPIGHVFSNPSCQPPLYLDRNIFIFTCLNMHE